MSIVSSEYSAETRIQSDGKVYVLETFTPSAGNVITNLYRAVPNADFAAILASRVPAIEAALAEAESSQILE